MSLEHFDEEKLYQKPKAKGISDFEYELNIIEECLENTIDAVSQNADRINASLRSMQRILEKKQDELEDLKKQSAFMEKCIFAMNN